ncbi:16S rRNA (uracil(1498)-N(3))-methyltransferase [Sporolactobacillus sp. CPB3-1]|uniref:Ribosomal RNA small subunit methyltransferase E n=1 Tax=Sporolactobacillus mangiferae TaxID=2940498 RepID=A0ABT0M6E5_9BACL|nr:16S rRNA (uracil(1498)-N(3))-methyltransferase [Sporolactobacillus mangiferae]MCL1630423.1 16S rRNA (uracil(1498)-N(3))-methyltransferase [Sporolactobacillus mangiferae]
MQRYFVSKNNIATDGHIIITGDDARHIQKVMRMRPSDRMICADNSGNAYQCVIEACGDDQVHAYVQNKLTADPELPIYVAIAQGMPKSDKFDTIVQKGTECGASLFIPFQAERSIAIWKEEKKDKKLLRLKKIGKEAAEQSHRLYIPEIVNPMGLDQLIAFSASFPFRIVAFEETAKSGEQAVLPELLGKMHRGERLLAVIGPEGGLTLEEAQKLKDHGFALCGLGPRILRTETAAVYLLSAISYHFELQQVR